MSIDALRGLDMFWIIGGGDVVSALAQVSPNRFTGALANQLEHVEWQGCRCFGASTVGRFSSGCDHGEGSGPAYSGGGLARRG
jgi:hypothetical protein